MEKITLSQPNNHQTLVHIAACFVHAEGHTLFLRRSKQKSESGTWGIAAGKSEKGEEIYAAAGRELREETGILAKPEPFQSIYIPRKDYCYCFHIYEISLLKRPHVIVDVQENDSFAWLYIADAFHLRLMSGGFSTLRFYLANRPALSALIQSYVNIHLIFCKENSILLSLRQNTGYYDGYYGLISGNVESGESAINAALREAKEEIGVVVEVKNLQLVEVKKRISDRKNLDLYFLVTSWKGEPQNLEPQKCSKLRLFSRQSLPNNTLNFVKEVIKSFFFGIISLISII
jgi:8-oxo-dGTP pyrophosphatase MutT (NUDIX family)